MAGESSLFVVLGASCYVLICVQIKYYDDLNYKIYSTTCSQTKSSIISQHDVAKQSLVSFQNLQVTKTIIPPLRKKKKKTTHIHTSHT